MSKNISISDEVYERLKREKGDRSFSEVIADKLDEGGKLADVAGECVLPVDVLDDVDTQIEGATEGTMERIDDETL